LFGFEAQSARSLPISESQVGRYYPARNCSTEGNSQAMS
jgi:hypothetical protein